MPALLVGFAAAVLYGSTVLWRRRFGGGLSPAGLYAVIWGGIWLVHWTGFMDYLPVSERGYLLSVLPLLGLFLGELLGLHSSWCRRFRQAPPEMSAAAFRRWTLAVGIVCLLSGLVTLGGSWLVFGNVLEHAQDLKRARVLLGTGMFEGSPLSALAKYSLAVQGCAYAACILGALYLRMVDGRYWPAVVLPLAGTVFFDLGWGSRERIFLFLLLFVIVLFLLPVREARDCPEPARRRGRRRTGMLRPALLVLPALLAGVLVMNLIGTSTRKTESHTIGGREIPFSVAQLIDYHAGQLVSFDRTIDQNPPTWGRLSLWGFEQWLRMFRVIPYSVSYPDQLMDWELEYISIQSDNSYGRTLNTYSWLRYLYSDFGAAGLLGVPLLLGWLATEGAKRWAARRRAFPSLLLCAACYALVLHSPSLMWTRDETFVFAVALLVAAGYRIAGARRGRADARAERPGRTGDLVPGMPESPA